MATLSTSAKSSQTLGDLNQDKSCQYNGMSYTVDSSLTTHDKELLTCRIYDAIIPNSADRLENGYAYWEKQMPANRVGIQLPRVLFNAPQPSH